MKIRFDELKISVRPPYDTGLWDEAKIAELIRVMKETGEQPEPVKVFRNFRTGYIIEDMHGYVIGNEIAEAARRLGWTEFDAIITG